MIKRVDDLMINKLKNLMIRGENPLFSLGNAYRLVIVLDLIMIPIIIVFYSILASVLAKYADTGNAYYLAESFRYRGILSLIGYFFMLIILLMLYWTYSDAGNYLDNSDMIWIGRLNLLEAIFISIGEPFVFLGLLRVAVDIVNHKFIGDSWGFGMVLFGSGFVIISGIIGIIAFIFLIKLLVNISSEWGIDQASIAIVLLVILIIYSFTVGSIDVVDAISAVIRGISEVIKTMINILIELALYKTFNSMGKIIMNYESNPEFVSSAISELMESGEKVDLKKLASRHKIPYALLKAKIIDLLNKGELKGSIVDNFFYPSKRKE